MEGDRRPDTLSETDAPDYYDGLSGDVTLTVTSEGITMSKGDDSDDVENGILYH